MTDSKYFTTTKKGEIFELKSELNNDKKEKKKEAVKKVIYKYQADVRSKKNQKTKKEANLVLNLLVFLYLSRKIFTIELILYL